jgi:predicted Zn-dependent protease with MMP-like domain
MINSTFSDYLLSILVKKVKQFDIKIDKNQKINENIKNEVNKAFEGIVQYEKIDNPNYKDKVMKILSFCQDNIKELKTLKESNINEFTKSFSSQINYVNQCIQEELRKNMENVVAILDLFFGRDFSERKKDLKEIDEFSNKIGAIKEAIIKLLNENKNKITSMGKGYKEKVLKSLYEKKSNLEKLLSSKNYEEILEEINKEMNNNIGELNIQIQEYLNNNDLECSKLIKEAKDVIDKFMEGGQSLSIQDVGFKSYISKKIGNEKKDLGKEIYEEIKNSCESLGNILAKKGFKEWFYSLFSSMSYLKNIIDMVVDTYSKKIDYALNIIDTESSNYLDEAVRSIEHNVGSATLTFNDEQLKKWNELCNSYEKTREIIMKIKIKN